MISIVTGTDVRDFLAHATAEPARFSRILACTPYVDNETIDSLVALTVSARRSQSGLRILTLPAVARRLVQALPGHQSYWHSTVLPVPSLHAKVYVSIGRDSDDHRAIVTSANLTGPGLNGNVELGLSAKPQTICGARVFREVAAFIDDLIICRHLATTTPLHMRIP